MALHAIASLPDRDGVTLLVTGDEEVGSTTSRALIEDEPPRRPRRRSCSRHPPGGALKIARKGVSLYEVVVTGRAAHAGLEPERGVNATVELAHPVLAIAALADPEPGTTVTPTVATSGTTTNTVPAARVGLRRRARPDDRRAGPGRCGAPRARAHVPGAGLEVKRRPEPPAAGGRGIRRAVRAVRRRSRRAIGSAGAGRASRSAAAATATSPPASACPTLDGLGAVGGGAHADDEHVLVAELVPRTRLRGRPRRRAGRRGPGGMIVTDLLYADEVVTTAIAAAEDAALAAGVTVRELAGIDEQAAMLRLLSEIWGRSPRTRPSARTAARLREGGQLHRAAPSPAMTMVGATIAFHSTPERHALHSHIAGVAPGLAGRSIGYAMKQHQRGWALARGIDVIEWTFDPLVARNAYFNCAKLRALPVEYLTNFYGVMPDVINGDDETDRLLVRWQLRDADVADAASGQPRRGRRRRTRPCLRAGARRRRAPAHHRSGGGPRLAARRARAADRAARRRRPHRRIRPHGGLHRPPRRGERP